MPSATAATLNLAATAAQCARLFAPYDAAFSAKCLTSARTAYAAAEANPAKRFGTIEEFGDACAYLCSAQAGFITGEILDLMVGLNRDFGTAIILITHDLGVVARVADLMKRVKASGGKIAFVAGPVVVHTGGSQYAELRESLLRLAVAHPHEQRHDPRGGAAVAEDAEGPLGDRHADAVALAVEQDLVGGQDARRRRQIRRSAGPRWRRASPRFDPYPAAQGGPVAPAHPPRRTRGRCRSRGGRWTTFPASARRNADTPGRAGTSACSGAR